MQSIRWSLLSTANINRKLIPAIRASARGELIAVASRNQKNAETYAKKWKIPSAFGSYEKMLAECHTIDDVFIEFGFRHRVGIEENAVKPVQVVDYILPFTVNNTYILAGVVFFPRLEFFYNLLITLNNGMRFCSHSLNIGC